MSTKRLIQKRSTLKAQLTRLKNSLSEDVSAAEARVKQKKVNDLLHEFEDIQVTIMTSKLEELDFQEGSRELRQAEEEIEDESNAEMEVFENTYYEAAAKIQRIIETDEERRVTERRVSMQNNGQDQQHVQTLNVKLPPIKIPEFKGEYNQWLSFKDAFKSSIHNNLNIKPFHKFQYLRDALVGEAAQVIAGIETTEENYAGAWELVTKHYENSKLLINTHMNQLLEFPDVAKDKPHTIKQLIIHVRSHLKTLKTLTLPTEHWDDLLVHMIKSKLDYYTQKDWEEEANKDKYGNRRPTLEEFLIFLNVRCCTLELIDKGKIKKDTKKYTPQKSFEKKVSLVSTSKSNCIICEGNHPIFKCPEFLKLTVPEKMTKVRDKKLCLNCLSSGHYASACKASSCKTCQRKHNTLLHYDQEEKWKHQQKPDHEESSKAVMHCTQQEKQTSVINNVLSARVNIVNKPVTQVILSTAQILVEDANGKQQSCRVLLDPGSQSNLVTETLVKNLKLKGKKQMETISGINKSLAKVAQIVNLKIKSVQTDFHTTIECLVIPTITEKLPQVNLNINSIQLPPGLKLADPSFFIPGTIDILIGAGLFWKLLCSESIPRPKGLPRLQNTLFGWIVGGEIIDTRSHSIPKVCGLVTDTQLQNQLERFWKQEEMAETKILNKEEMDCEQQFAESMRRDESGRYIVALPKKSEILLGESENQAKRRLFSIERRFKSNADLKKEYIKFMKDYKDQQHMSEVKETEYLQTKEIFLIPHQPVIRPDSATTKLRVVFDASAKTSNGNSLNNKLLIGPNLQNELFDIILRFRGHEYVMTADIAAMFRQILIIPEDRDLQRILWREDSSLPIKTFRLNTVTYGTAPAPYLAIKCLRELAAAESELNHAAQVLRNDFYMDDVLTGHRTLEGASLLQQQLSKLLLKGQFQLRKWRANDERILQGLTNEEDKSTSLMKLEKEGATKTLGLLWDSKADCLQYHVTTQGLNKVTKRQILSKISQIYDPLGLLGPVIINGKIFMQKMWKIKADWDDTLPNEISESWINYYQSLKDINGVKIQRNINMKNVHEYFDLIGFGDSSEKAYGACLYAVYRNQDDQLQSSLITSKTRVSPLKTISLPRLELNAALLLSRLNKVVMQAFGNKVNRNFLFSDSTIVLSWIKSEPSTRKIYVANRITEIQDLTKNAIWLHVNSEDNPADLPSRGISVQEWKVNKLWWQGPKWLTEEEWPHQPKIIHDASEMKTLAVLTTTRSSDDNLLTRYSSYNKLLRVVAYCLRFHLNNTKGMLTVKELDAAEKAIINMVQFEEFQSELLALKQKQEVSKNSKIIALNPFIDKDSIIRVGGRIQMASVPEAKKHPIVLPAKHHITKLILEKEHIRLFHCGVEQLLNSIRQKYWPLNGRQVAKKVVRKCISCFRNNPKFPEIIMGNLPKERVQGNIKPFKNTGVDYAGPLKLRESKRRGRIHIAKAWIAVFVCMSTKAIHLELVTELSTESFLAALRRFVARRGICSQISSDNGTNFVGAARELKEVYSFLRESQQSISSYLSTQNIEWKFIPPKAPHFGGLWEAAVKLTKKHLLVVTKGIMLTFEECYTLLTEIEAILNSRPLTPISNDPNDMSVLTPGHFLIGEALVAPAEINYRDTASNRLSRWQHIQKVRQHFWKRWYMDYLPQLQKRHKWCSKGEELQIGTLVLLKDDNALPLQWQTGRILEIYPGPDDVARVAMIKTKDGLYKRALKNVCPLPTQEED